MNERGFYFREQQHIQILCGISPAPEASCQELFSFPEDFCKVEAEAAILLQAEHCIKRTNKMQKSNFSDFDDGSYF